MMESIDPLVVELAVERVANGWVVNVRPRFGRNQGELVGDIFVATSPAELSALLMVWATEQTKVNQ